MIRGGGIRLSSRTGLILHGQQGNLNGIFQLWIKIAMPVEPSQVTEIESRAAPAVPSIKLSEILSIVMALRTKADSDWYRVIYLHAALIGAMVFFAGQRNEFAFARLVVFAFYSFNVAVSFAALRESYEGLRHATSDLRSFPPHHGGAAVQKWLGSRYNHDQQTDGPNPLGNLRHDHNA